MYLYEIKVSLTQEELVFIDKRAQESGQTLSEVIEEIIKEQMHGRD